MINFVVMSRPAGGSKMVLAVCTDRLGHAFVYDERMNRLALFPACDKRVQIIRPTTKVSTICATCELEIEAWRGEMP